MIWYMIFLAFGSRPVWACGLKLLIVVSIVLLMSVAPRVGVWIETHIKCLSKTRLMVAPRVGVWIETLKRGIEIIDGAVAPRVGVWIETT